MVSAKRGDHSSSIEDRNRGMAYSGGSRPVEGGRTDDDSRPERHGRREGYDRVRAEVDDSRIQVLSSTLGCSNYNAIKDTYAVRFSPSFISFSFLNTKA